MNILFSCDEYPPIKSGGIGSVTRIVAEELARKGHKVFVISGILPCYDLPSVDIQNGVEIHRFKYFSSLSFLFGGADKGYESFVLRVLKKTGLIAKWAKSEFYRTHRIIQEFIKENKIEIVEFPDYLKLSDYYKDRQSVEFPSYDIPMIARVHGSQSFAAHFRDGIIHPITLANDVSFFKRATKVLAVSRFSADVVYDIIGVKKSIDVIYNPLNLQNVDNATRDRVPMKNDNNIVFVGKIVETKGAFKLIEAFNKFVVEHPEYTLTLIGGGDIDKGKKLVNPKYVNSVRFTGYLSLDKVYQTIQDATFCVIPSFFENFSMATLEVMSLGKALVYTKEASGKEVINDGVDGLLVDPRNVDEIKEKMLILANNVELRENMGKKAAEKIRSEYSISNIVDQLEAYYQKTINNN